MVRPTLVVVQVDVEATIQVTKVVVLELQLSAGATKKGEKDYDCTSSIRTDL